MASSVLNLAGKVALITGFYIIFALIIKFKNKLYNQAVCLIGAYMHSEEFNDYID